MEIYILAGQSNMAGRGRCRELPPRYQRTNNEVMCFNAKGDWVQANEPLHKDVNLRKANRCGVGPALVCARALLELRVASPRSSQSRTTCIGLVPCAIGGSSLAEWQKSYRGVVGDCEVSTEHAGAERPTLENCPWAYKPGSENLFGAMAARAEEALQAAPEGSYLGGVLWYQGESDSMGVHRAQTYYERFETLVKDIRGLGYPDLKIFTVAVTGSIFPRLSFLRQVRHAQLRAGSSTGLTGVWVTDAFGLPMSTDGLHLRTNAQVELGERMALQIFAATEPTAPAQAAIDGWTRDWTTRDVGISRAEKDLHSIASMARTKLDSEDSAMSQVKFSSFAKVLFFLEPRPSSGDRLLVLGCGAGACVMTSALLYSLDQIQGIDLKQGCLGEAHALLSVYSGEVDQSSEFVTDTAKGGPSWEESKVASRTPPSKIDFQEGVVADARWGDASLVYAASCHFDDTVMLTIAKLCRGLTDGARVITLDKPLPQVLADSGEEELGANGEFRVAWQCQVEGCWGGPAVAFVHERVASLA